MSTHGPLINVTTHLITSNQPQCMHLNAALDHISLRRRLGLALRYVKGKDFVAKRLTGMANRLRSLKRINRETVFVRAGVSSAPQKATVS